MQASRGTGSAWSDCIGRSPEGWTNYELDGIVTQSVSGQLAELCANAGTGSVDLAPIDGDGEGASRRLAP